MPYTSRETAEKHYKENYWTAEDEMWANDRVYNRPRMEIVSRYIDKGVRVDKIYEKGMHHQRTVDSKFYRKGKVYNGTQMHQAISTYKEEE